MKIISFILKQSGWLESKPKSQNYIAKKPIFSYRLQVLEIFSFIIHFPVHFLCTDHYSNFALTFLIILMVIGNATHILRRTIKPFPI